MMDTQEAITRYRLVLKIEQDSGRDLSVAKRRILNELNLDQIEELAARVYAENGPLGTPRELQQYRTVTRG